MLRPALPELVLVSVLRVALFRQVMVIHFISETLRFNFSPIYSLSSNLHADNSKMAASLVTKLAVLVTFRVLNWN